MTNAEAIETLRANYPDACYEQLREAVDAAIDALKAQETEGDTISRQAAIDGLWKALYAYEDKTEKQFQESDDLDVSDWIAHRIFVQNMSDIDRQTILNLPPAQSEIIYCGECKYASPNGVYGCRLERFSVHDESVRLFAGDYCSAGKRRTDESDK